MGGIGRSGAGGHVGGEDVVGVSVEVVAAGGGVPVHPDATGVEQNRTAGAVADGLVEGSADRGWEWDEDGLAAFAEDTHDAVAVFLAEVGDIQAGGFEDPQPKEPEKADQREVEPVRSLPGGGQQRLELEVSEAEGRGFCRDVWPADVFGRGVFEQAVDDRGAVEPGDDRHPSGGRGRLEPADLLHPAHIQLDLWTRGRQWIDPPLGAPGQECAQVGLGVRPRECREPAEVRGDGDAKQRHVVNSIDSGERRRV